MSIDELRVENRLLRTKLAVAEARLHFERGEGDMVDWPVAFVAHVAEVFKIAHDDDALRSLQENTDWVIDSASLLALWLLASEGGEG